MKAEEIEMLKRAIDTHVNRLFNDAEAYKNNGNREAQMDCIAEMRLYDRLKKSL